MPFSRDSGNERKSIKMNRSGKLATTVSTEDSEATARAVIVYPRREKDRSAVYSVNKDFNLLETAVEVAESITPRRRTRLEQWTVANL